MNRLPEMGKGIKVEWEDAGDGKKEGPAVALANTRNQEMVWQGKIGFAKAVFRLHVEKNEELGLWKVRKVTFEPPVQKSGNFLSGLLSTSSTIESAEMQLLAAIQDVIKCIHQNENQLTDAVEVIKKLNKFMIRLLQLDVWPLTKPENTIQKVIDCFRDYQKHCEARDFLLQNQKRFKTYVSQLNKALRMKIMTVSNASEKLVTKLKREVPQGSQLYDRIQELIELGTERVYWHEKEQHHEVVYFARAFALHAYVYKKDQDNQKTRELLDLQLDRFLELMIAYDHLNKSSELNVFFCRLIEHIVNYQGNHFRISQASYGALLWTLEDMVKNKRFIAYMQSPERQNQLSVKDLHTLFLHEHTWESVGRLIVALGNLDIFTKVVEARLSVSENRCLLNETQINLLFRELNQRVQAAQRSSYQKMYRIFLDLLSRLNRLHYLKAYAEDERHVEILRGNLTRLGFSFVTEPGATLPPFFGNATFRAIKDNRPEIPVGANVRFALLRLFSKCGKNPVVREKEFNQALEKLLADFRIEGFEVICEEMIGSIGEGIPPLFVEVGGERKWKPIEDWISDEVFFLYQILKKYVLLSLPLKWKMTRLDDGENYLDRLCLFENKLFKVVQTEKNEFLLVDIFTQEEKPVPKQELWLSDLLPNVKVQLKDQMSPPAGPHQEETRKLNRRGVSRVTEQYMLFHNDKQDKKVIQRLLDMILQRMVADHRSLAFVERLEIIAEFLNAMSPVFANIESLVKLRFFTNQQKLKLGVARELVLKADLYKENDDLKLKLPADGSAVDFSNELVTIISKLLSLLCTGNIEDILTRCSLQELRKAAPRLEYVIGRKLDELSYETKEFITSFLAHDINKNQLPGDVLKDAIGTLAIKEEIIQEYQQVLNERIPPVYFLLPNQAIAIQLAISTKTELATKNILMRLGTGQGKSLAIAYPVLIEARKIKDTPHSRVCVLTSYNHLADRDHDLGKHFFQKDNTPSVRILELKDVDDFTPQTKIIYARQETIEQFVRDILLLWFQNKATEYQKEFVKFFYGVDGGEMRIILDEYDLLLHDNATQDPRVASVPTSVLPPAFVKDRNNSPYCSFLPGQIDAGAGTATVARDQHSGLTFAYVPWYAGDHYNLPVSVLRLSTLIKKATRVLGYSGTASLNESAQLPKRLFFELPSSQNPEIFETKILQKNEPPPPGDKSYIACREYLEITAGIRELNGIFEFTDQAVKQYCDVIVQDIKAARKVTESDPYQRPILIFCDNLLKYQKPGRGPRDPLESLWNKLVEAIKSADIPLSFFPDKVSDNDLQEAAREGRVTLTSIENGRGADIRVNSKILEGLHVIVGIPVAHLRLLKQLIGRTGRMGRKGSYSVVTLGKLIKDQKLEQTSVEFCEALHELTKLFVKKLSESSHVDEEWCKRWILFFTNTFSTRMNPRPTIHLNHAKMFCGADCGNNAILKPYFG